MLQRLLLVATRPPASGPTPPASCLRILGRVPPAGTRAAKNFSARIHRSLPKTRSPPGFRYFPLRRARTPPSPVALKAGKGLAPGTRRSNSMTTRRRPARPPENAVPLLASCSHCGQFYEPGASSVEGACPTCAEERYTTCPECGRTVENTQTVTLEGGRRICQSCADELAVLCTECGRWHMADAVQHITDRHGNRVCEHCWEAYARCKRCCPSWAPSGRIRPARCPARGRP